MQSPNCMQLSVVVKEALVGLLVAEQIKSHPHETLAEVVKNPNIYKCQKLVENDK